MYVQSELAKNENLSFHRTGFTIISVHILLINRSYCDLSSRSFTVNGCKILLPLTDFVALTMNQMQDTRLSLLYGRRYSTKDRVHFIRSYDGLSRG